MFGIKRALSPETRAPFARLLYAIAGAAEFNSGIEEMRAASYYDAGIDVEYGDRLLILSTCDYDESNGRFVVVAVRKDDL